MVKCDFDIYLVKTNNTIMAINSNKHIFDYHSNLDFSTNLCRTTVDLVV